MHNEAGGRQLNERRVGQREHDRRKFGEDASLEVLVGDIADRYEQEPTWSSRQQVAAHEICVFGHHHAALKVRKAADFSVGGAVTSGKIASVDGVMSEGAQAAREPSRQLCVDEELHAAGGCTRLT